MQAISPREFVEHVLIAALGVRWMVVGHDFRFGQGRKGTVPLLREMGEQLGFGVDEVPPFTIAGQRVSSSMVREALANGNLPYATELLGRPCRMSGKVIEGKRLGRTLGFPTANLALHRRVIPMMGIFAVRVSGAELNNAPGVAYLGTRPVVNGIEPLLEAHVFDFDGNLYGKYLHVDFIARLRGELPFKGLDELVTQMHEDAAKARAILT